MISIIPQILYGYHVDLESQTTVGLSMVYLVTLILMFASQCLWILMALRTPPGKCMLVADVHVVDDKGNDIEEEEHTIDEV